MANSVTTQTLIDGQRNVVVKFEGVLDTSDLASTTIADPSLLSDVDFNSTKATKLRIDEIEYDISDDLSVNIYWDATTPVRAMTLTDRGEFDATKYGGLQNNAGAGVNGKITATTFSWGKGNTGVPTAPILSSVTSGALGAATYFVQTTYVTTTAETLPSVESSLAVASNNVVAVASPPDPNVSGVTGYNVYVSLTTGTETLQNSVPIPIGTSWQEPDTGLVAGTALPTTDTLNSAKSFSIMFNMSKQW